MEKLASNVPGPTLLRGHRRSSSLPVPPVVRGKLRSGPDNGKHDEDSDFVDLNGLVDTFNQISDSLSRPAKILVGILDSKNGNVEIQDSQEPRIVCQVNENLYFENGIEGALKQLNTIQVNFTHVMPHMESILKDYKSMKERTQSRDEMLKTLDKALRRSEGRSRTLLAELQDTRDENKCLREKAQQNESILRFLNTDDHKGNGGDRTARGVVKGSRRPLWNKGEENLMERGGLKQGEDGNCGEPVCATDGRNKDLGAKLEHYQKVLCDYESQLQEVVLLNKELVLKINERESEVMNLNCELLKHQETLAVYEEEFKNLSRDNSRLEDAFREERKRAAEFSEKLDDTEGYISCITDKVASYEVELKFLRQELRKRDKN